MAIHYFAFEGPDGVGKTTIIDYLTNYFTTNTKYKVFCFSASNSALGKEVKKIIANRDLFWEVESRLHHATLEYLLTHGCKKLENKYKNNNEENCIVFFDRWFPSTVVYQFLATFPKDKISHALNAFFFQSDDPTIKHFADTLDYFASKNIDVIYLDAHDETLDKRLYKDRSEQEKYEAKDFQDNVRESYRQLFKYLKLHKLYNTDIRHYTDSSLESNAKELLSKIIQRLNK